MKMVKKNEMKSQRHFALEERRRKEEKGRVSSDCIFKGPLGRSLCLFARTAHFAYSLHSALLCYTHLLYSWAYSLTILAPTI